MRPRRGGFAVALTLIIAGLVFLFINTGIIPTEYESLLTAWPIWLVLVSLFLIFHRNFGTGLIILAVGLFFLIPYLRPIHPELGIPDHFTRIYWPLLLILGGVLLIVEKFVCHKGSIFVGCKPGHTSKWDNEDGFLRIETAFDSRKNIVLDPVFKGGDVRCSFGEVVIDLRKTSLAEGTTKLIVDVSFGSATIIVPNTWNVQVRGDGFFGTFNDHRLTKSFYPDEPRKLTIEGKVAFGECEVRD